MTHLRIFIVKTETESEHQIVRCLEVLQIISDVKKGAAGDVYFQCKNLIKASHISTTEHIGSHADPNRKIRHHILCTRRKSQSQLVLNARFQKLTGRAAAPIFFSVYIGTAIIDTVQRSTYTQLITQVIHRSEIESGNRICIGRRYLLLAYPHAFPTP